MKIVKSLILASACCLLAEAAFAHTKLLSAAPAPGASVQLAPSALELGFSEEVRLMKVILSDAQGTEIDIGFAVIPAAQKDFSVTLPDLGMGSFTARWTALGADGHRVEGSIDFKIDASAPEATGSLDTHSGH